MDNITEVRLKLLVLREKFNWIGNYSGYDRFLDYLGNYYGIDVTTEWKYENSFLPTGLNNICRKLAKKFRKSPFYNGLSFYSEIKTIIRAYLVRPSIIHVTFLENNLLLLPHLLKGVNTKLVSTSHQPPEWWQYNIKDKKFINNLDALIVVTASQLEYFSDMSKKPVYFIHHGVDTEFFKPAEHQDLNEDPGYEKRCVFAGKWLRDIQTLILIMEDIIEKRDDIAFDLILPEDNGNKYMSNLRIKESDRKRISIHSGLSDNNYREVLQNADILLLPLLDCTANNTLLEAMACGLPIVSNEVGGIRDYVNEDFCFLHEKGDVEGMRDSVFKIIDDIPLHLNMKKAAREYAMKNLRWDLILDRTIEVYRRL